MNDRTEAARAEGIRLFNLRYPNIVVRMTQGAMFGHGGGAGPSAGTHDGTSVWDDQAIGLTRKQALYLVACYRRVGIASWLRLYLRGVWPTHIHNVLIGSKGLAPVAARQVTSFKRKRTGLVGDRIDTLNPWVGATTWEKYKKAHPPKPEPAPPTPPPAPPKSKGLFGMGSPERKTYAKPVALAAGKDRTLQLTDKGDVSIVIGPTGDFTCKVKVAVTGLPVGQSILFRPAQVDRTGTGDKAKNTEVYWGADEAVRLTGTGGLIETSFVFDGRVSTPPKGASRRVRVVANPSAPCTITRISTYTRKA